MLDYPDWTPEDCKNQMLFGAEQLRTMADIEEKNGCKGYAQELREEADRITIAWTEMNWKGM